MYIIDELRKKKLIKLPGFEIKTAANLISRGVKHESLLTLIFKDELVKHCRDFDF
jgi:hypothetical protein